MSDSNFVVGEAGMIEIDEQFVLYLLRVQTFAGQQIGEQLYAQMMGWA